MMETSNPVVNYGSCKWFNSTKGFGFITPDDGTSDVFVHQSSIQADGFRSLAEGERVEYTVEMDKRSGRVKANMVTGPDGVNVKGAPKKTKLNRGGFPHEGPNDTSNRRFSHARNQEYPTQQQHYYTDPNYPTMVPYAVQMGYPQHQQQFSMSGPYAQTGRCPCYFCI